MRRRIRKIKEERVFGKKGTFARIAKGEKEPRSYRKIASEHEIAMMRNLKRRGVEFPAFRVIKKDGQNNLFIRAAGKKVSDFSPRYGLKPEEKKQIALQVAKNLGKIHSAGVEHMDVRSGNIFWDAQKKRASLLDFSHAEAKEINLAAASSYDIFMAFAREIYSFRRFLEEELKIAKPKEYIFKLIENYSISKEKKREMIEMLRKRFQKR